MKYVAGFLFSFDLQQVLLIRREKHPFKDKWAPISGKIEQVEKVIKQTWFGLPERMTSGELPDFEEKAMVDEIPHAAMRREFLKEADTFIVESRWHCFHIKEYSNGNTVYFFVAFGDEIKKFKAYQDYYLGQTYLCTHSYIDLVFNSGSEYVFDTKYLIDIILSEFKANNLMQLNPQGVNSWKTAKKS